jgi:adenylate kinase
MKQITCIFFGRSGSGKGTQSAQLLDYLKKNDPEREALYVDTGRGMRTFTEGNTSFPATCIQDVLKAGGLQPAFIPIWIWTDFLLKNLKENEHIVFDGVARRHEESPILDQALQFLKREKPAVILLDVSDEEAKRRLLARGRFDDKEEEIAKRLKWFQTDAMQAIHYFERSPHFNFIHINAEKSIEDVHKDILEKLEIA